MPSAPSTEEGDAVDDGGDGQASATFSITFVGVGHHEMVRVLGPSDDASGLDLTPLATRVPLTLKTYGALPSDAVSTRVTPGAQVPVHSVHGAPLKQLHRVRYR